MNRTSLKNKQRIVVKIGSSSLTHPESKNIDYRKLERLVRVLSDLRNQGKDVVLVTSGAQVVGRKVMSMVEDPSHLPQKQALAAIGQAKLMMIYQRLFSEYNQNCAQVLLTKHNLMFKDGIQNAQNTFNALLNMGVIPVVNENDTVATDEIEFGDNDTLSAFVLALIHADLLIILSDIDGFYTDDPTTNPKASLISEVEKINDTHFKMGKDSSSSGVGTGGMNTKIKAAKIATEAGADMVLASGHDVFNIYRIVDGEPIGTCFSANPLPNFDLLNYIKGSDAHE
ncbi:gamma-glutamyl kinase [Erysipelothrix larvae]|uniref:Glutamate 5-kinase n=1 Tax=Erysipelothrix larvae TaxID=1514105 RepID=A0A120JTY7_9FIRM|nr:glutamate 5-kinase [Erysipelothrix larvae]AMC94366.1 gamma-glutamyl kinase [Erysipelothrix larvae]